jgi:RHS repeat-associated protein
MARPHAVSTAGARSYQYNAVGQMTSRNGTVIQWNGDGKPSLVGNVGFTYDGLGERLKKVSGGQTTRYIGGNYEIAPEGTVTKYLHGGKKVGATFFIHHRDHLGSIQAVTNASGDEVRRQKHKPFGDQHFVSGSHAESKGWIGEREEETELLYLNARYYDPEIGRFTAPDPILRWTDQGLNRYSYSRNNVINLSDPSGLDPITDPCAGMTTEQCDDFLQNNIDEDTFKAQCELNPSCRDFLSNDPSLNGWMDETETALWQIHENNFQRWLREAIDCTKPGANCEDGPPPPPPPVLNQPVPPKPPKPPRPPEPPKTTTPDDSGSPKPQLPSELDGWYSPPPCFESFGTRFSENVTATNSVVPGILAPSLFVGVSASSVVARALAAETGSLTFLQGLTRFIAGSANGTIPAGNVGWLAQGASNSAAAVGLTGFTWVAAVAAGSAVEAQFYIETCR